MDEQDKATKSMEFGTKILEVIQCLDILIRYYSQKYLKSLQNGFCTILNTFLLA